MAPSRRNASGRLLLLPREDYSPLPSHSPRDTLAAPCSPGSMHPDSPLEGSPYADRKVSLVSLAKCASPSQASKTTPRPLRSTLSAPSPASETGIEARMRRAGNVPSIALPNRPATQNPFEQMLDGADTPTPLPVSFGGSGSLFPPSSATGGSSSGTAQDGRPATAHGRFAGGGGRSWRETPWYEPRGPLPGAAEPSRPLVIDTLGGMPPWCTASASEEALSEEVNSEERHEFSASEGSSSDGGRGSSSESSSSDSEDSIAWKTEGGSSFSSLEAASSTHWFFGNWLLWWPEEGKSNVAQGMAALAPENKKLTV